MRRMNNIFIRMIIIPLMLIIFGCYQRIEIDNVRVITGKELYKYLEAFISKADKSIYILMYYIKDHEKRNSFSHKILKQLIGKQKSGVDVYIIVEGSDKEDDIVTGYNKKVYKYLRRRGIYISFDSKFKISHAKTIIIDERYVFLGSANITDDAMTSNIEANVLVNSERIARKLIEYFRKIEECRL